MIEKNMGFVFGVFLGLIIVCLLFKFANKDGKIKTEYDERQEAVRGIGYKYAFWTYTTLMGIFTVYDMAFGSKIPLFALAFSAIVIAGIVLSLYCIIKGAYWGQNNNKKIYIIIFIVAGVINIISAVSAILSGTMIVDGVIQVAYMNLICGIMMAIIGVAIAISSKKESEE